MKKNKKVKVKTAYALLCERREKAFKELNSNFKVFEKRYGREEFFYAMRKYIDKVSQKNRAEKLIKAKEQELKQLKLDLA